MQSRCLSGNTASCSGRSRHDVCSQGQRMRLVVHPRVCMHGRPVTRVAVMVDKEGNLLPISPNFFVRDNPSNREPDFADPDWWEKVTDWEEFWNHTRWDIEAEDFDEDQLDMAGNPTNTLDRAYQLIDAVNAVKGKPQVDDLLTPQTRRIHLDAYEDPPVEPETQVENPPWDYNDWRAYAEKQRYKDLLDHEWRKRQSKIGKLAYPHKDNRHDVRFREFDYLNETWDWSAQDIRSLITMGETACPPEKHKAFVENPLAPVDYVNTMGVVHIENTEDFLERIGHLGVPPPLDVMSMEDLEELVDGSPDHRASGAILDANLQVYDKAEQEAVRKAEGNTWRGDD